MKSEFRKSFLRDLKKIKDAAVLDAVQSVLEAVDKAKSSQEIPELKKLSGEKDYFRIRVSDYRIGVRITNAGIEFIRCLSRKDIYRFFPD